MCYLMFEDVSCFKKELHIKLLSYKYLYFYINLYPFFFYKNISYNETSHIISSMKSYFYVLQYCHKIASSKTYIFNSNCQVFIDNLCNLDSTFESHVTYI